jgi:ketosteroid isomerase-like protein
MSPPPGDREVIMAEVEAIRKAVENQNPKGILSRLEEGFKFQGASKSELRSHLVAFFFQNSDVRLDLAGVDATVEGDSATSSGSYSARWKSGPTAPDEVRTGRFIAKWRKIEGQWKIVEATGDKGAE